MDKRRSMAAFVAVLVAVLAMGFGSLARAQAATGLDPAWARAHPVVRVGALRPGVPPMQIVENGRLLGVGADFLEQALPSMGVSWQPVLFDSRQSLLDALCKGTVDIAPEMISTPAAMRCIDFGTPYLASSPVRVARNGDSRFVDDAALAGARIAVVAGSPAEEIIVAALPNAKLLRAPDDLSALDAVVQGRADVYLANPLMAVRELDRLVATGKLQYTGRSTLPLARYGFAYGSGARPLEAALQVRLDTLGDEARGRVVGRWVAVFEPSEDASLATPLSAGERQFLQSLPVIGAGIDSDWAPMSYMDRNGVSVGVASDYVAELNRALGLRTRRVNVDTVAEAQQAIADGKVQMLVSVARDNPLSAGLVLSRAYEVAPLVVAGRNDAKSVSGLDDLRGKRVAVVDRPFDIATRLHSSVPLLQVVSFPYTDDALHALAERRVDAVVDTVSVLSQHIDADYAGRLRILGPSGITMSVHIGVVPSQAQLVPLIDRVLADVSAARSQAIRARWMRTTYSYATPWSDIALISIPILLVGVVVVIIVLRANRQLRHAVEAEQRARAMAEDATRSKAQFLAMMSHEIRTPMTSALGMIDLLERTPLDDDQRDMAGVMRESGDSLLRIIDDLLDFSRFEAGQMPLEAVPFDVRPLFDDVAGLLGATVRAKGLLLYASVDARVGARLVGDPARLRQVLFNLTGNAVKFTQRGFVRMHLAWVGGVDTQQLAIVVQDTGVGIAPERKAEIFEPFIQEDASTQRRFGGTGLGLAIVSRIATLMGARVTLESIIGTGTRFEFAFDAAVEATLPAVDSRRFRLELADPMLAECVASYLQFAGLQAEDGAQAAGVVVTLVGDPSRPADAQLQLAGAGRTATLPAWPPRLATLRRALHVLEGHVQAEDGEGVRMTRPAPSREVALGEGRLVMVVDDQPLIQRLLVRELRMLGYACDVASDGEEALRCMRSTNYGLLLTDCFMAGMDGFELMRRVRASGWHLPMLAMTASPLPELIERCRRAGADGVVTKPLRLGELKSMLERYLPETASPGTEEAVEGPATIVANLRGAMGDEAAGFIAQLKAQAGRDRSAFADAIDAGDAPAVATIAHQYASIFGWARAPRLRELARAVEAEARSGTDVPPSARALLASLQELDAWLALE
ncbi:ATP-binding protein [Pinirhizobacter soli]|uniref:ATP-binding protein n=1 Tax=Pinirhizobacter soli TaxID=2786953 RepID=UPI00202AB0CD|nr:transporter substrate-binding domain-containing protein [Pinirhizobacter soli]